MSVPALASASLGSLFTIPADDWTALNRRVGLTYLAHGIAPVIAEYLPSYAALDAACARWRSATFGALVAQSGALAQYASGAEASFTGVQTAIAGLPPGQQLPAPVLAQAGSAITALAASTATFNATFGSLCDDVLAFTSANAATDAQIDAYRQRLGPDWTALGPETDAVDRAAGLVLGTWQAMAHDLAAIAADPIEITTQFLLSLEIAAALRSWQGLQAEAVAFATMAQGQQQNLDGTWLGARRPGVGLA